MSTTVVCPVTFRVINCSCGGTYAINDRYATEKQNYGGSWTCPYCKTGWGFTESELAKTQRLLSEANSAKARLQSSYDQLDANRRDLERKKIRLEKRISRGVCPCCNRSFENLQRHMKTKHPEQVAKAK